LRGHQWSQQWKPLPSRTRINTNWRNGTGKQANKSFEKEYGHVGVNNGAGHHPIALGIDLNRTVLYSFRMAMTMDVMLRKGAEEARSQLPDLLEAAEKGRSTIITKHGRPVAALVPIEAYGTAVRQQPLMPVAGSGRGLWGKDSARRLRKLRDEWSR